MKKSFLARRSFLKTAGQSLLAAPALSLLSGIGIAEQSSQSKSAKQNPPVADSKPKLVLNIRDFGATGDGTTKETAAIQQTIDRCSVFGGGDVLVPAGNYLTGSIQLKSNVTLRFEDDATITGSPDYADYPVTQVRWEGKWIQGHIALIYSIDASHIGIVGPGKIVAYVPPPAPFNPQMKLRRPALVEPINCTNIHFEGYSTSNHGMWSLHPTCCENLIFKDLTIRSTGGLGDGVDVDSCKHVAIDGCDISTGDDCISLKSGRGSEGYTLHQATEDVHISNCTFADSNFACIGIGSETSGGIRNVHIEHCKFTGAKTFALYIKSRPGRGAFIEDIVANDLEVSGTQGGLIRFNLLGSGKQDESPVPGIEGIPTVRNFRFSSIHVTDAPILVDGTSVHPDKPLEGLSLTNITGTCAKGIYLANIRRANIQNINVQGYTRALINAYNVTGVGLHGVAPVEAPKIGDPVPVPAQPYQLQ
ncbi:MAG: glycoside hydrolase family 28 protein [Terracidiphilus sp.]|jgi:polygalacturonase